MSPEATAAPLTVSVIVPVYNESATIADVVGRLLSLPDVTEVVVVDDGSLDGGFGQFSAIDDARVIVLRHPTNQGKGAAIRTALARATGDVIVIQDADREYAPEEIPKLLAPIQSGDALVVYGTRFGGRSRVGTSLVRYVANRLLTWLSNLATGLSLSDMETGHKAFRREALDDIVIRENRFGFEPEITAKLAKRGVRIIEVPVSYVPRSYADGKKIGLRDGLHALWCIVRYS